LIRIATRGSALARWQAEHVASLLRDAHDGLDVELVIVDTIGDRDKASSLSAIGGQGIFVKEVQAAVLDGRADLAVHSGKDLPSNAALQAPGLAIAAVPERADARDALVGSRLADIPPGGTIATGSSRRRALLADLRPDLTFADLRGNMDTRLAKAAEFAAVVVAAAALDRLGLADRIAERLDASVLIPQVAQGALAIEARCACHGRRRRGPPHRRAGVVRRADRPARHRRRPRPRRPRHRPRQRHARPRRPLAPRRLTVLPGPLA
jgi:hydroxymethylbilane synthase